MVTKLVDFTLHVPLVKCYVAQSPYEADLGAMYAYYYHFEYSEFINKVN